MSITHLEKYRCLVAHTFSLGTMITSININEKIKCHIFKQYFFFSEENISLSHYLFVIVSFPGKKHLPILVDSQKKVQSTWSITKLYRLFLD